MSERTYPDDPAGAFPAPPIGFEDGEGRSVTVETVDLDDFGELVDMYVAFDPADRAQGIPPVQEEAIHSWLDELLVEGSVNVVARLGDDLVGHAILVPDRDDSFELAVFVLGDYQGAGIGTKLMEGLLGAGRERGVEKVWLTVERWNDPAIALYRKIGFETSDAESFELEMSIRLA